MTRRSPQQVIDAAWDEEMTRLLREAAEVREDRERLRASEGALLTRREAAALHDAIRTHARPNAQHAASHPMAGRAARPRQVDR